MMGRTGFTAQGGGTRVPRTLFENAISADDLPFPPRTDINDPIVFILLPNDWNGTSALYYWFLGLENTGAVTYDFTLEAGGPNEAYTTHNQTVNNKAVNVLVNEYELIDLTTDLATVIALLNGGDMLKITLNDDAGVQVSAIGVEIRES